MSDLVEDIMFFVFLFFPVDFFATVSVSTFTTAIPTRMASGDVAVTTVDLDRHVTVCRRRHGIVVLTVEQPEDEVDVSAGVPTQLVGVVVPDVVDEAEELSVPADQFV